jgi:hypothetical protein
VKKAARIAARVLLGLLFVLGVGAFLCLDRVDYRPYFREPYYKTTISRLSAAAKTNALARGEYRRGSGAQN